MTSYYTVLFSTFKVDEYLASQGKPKAFSKHFEGVFSDQKICQGCPHRYEREQTFMALNLTVKSNNLQESLDQVGGLGLYFGLLAFMCYQTLSSF